MCPRVERRAAVRFACVAAALLMASCGTGGREADVAGVAARFQNALAQDDGALACSELSASTVAALREQEARPCADAVLALDLPAGGTVRHVDVFMTSAAVRLQGTTTAFLDQGPEGWRVSAAGCEPAPSDEPFRCELED